MEPFIDCDKCCSPINEGESYVSIVRNFEQTEFFPHERRLVTQVSESEQILTLCDACGKSLCAVKISETIKVNIQDNSIKQQTN